MKKNLDKVFLNRIIESIDRIDHYIMLLSMADFVVDVKTVDATLMQLVNIGETINHLSSELIEKYNHVPWHKATGIRNQIAHGYFDIKPEEIWRTCKKDLPELKKQVESIL